MLIDKGYYSLNDSDPTERGVDQSNSHSHSHSNSHSDLESNQGLDEIYPTTTKIRAKRMADPLWLAFWEAYPRKQGKERAMVKFSRIPKKEIPKLMEALEEQKKNWRDIEFTPMPSTWLNQRRWEDQITKNTTDPMEAYARELLKQFPSSNDTTAQFRFAKKYGNENLLKFKNLFNL
jgi:hypothetical protein